MTVDVELLESLETVHVEIQTVGYYPVEKCRIDVTLHDVPSLFSCNCHEHSYEGGTGCRSVRFPVIYSCTLPAAIHTASGLILLYFTVL